MYIAQVCWIHDGKNGIAGTHGTIDIHEVQIIPRKGKKFRSHFKLLFILQNPLISASPQS